MTDPIARAKALLAKIDPALVEYTLDGVRTSAYIEAATLLRALVAEAERLRASASYEECERREHRIRALEAEVQRLNEHANFITRGAVEERKDLEAENAELRERRDDWQKMANERSAEIIRLNAENAELRGNQTRRCNDYPSCSCDSYEVCR